MKMTCIITDDEPFARKGLAGYVEKAEFLELTAVCEDALQLNAILQRQRIDLLFLDIEMPQLSGIAFLKTLAQPPMVIFTTAYEQYALDGFDLDVTDYLLKPISFERFLKAANKAHRLWQQQQQPAPADHIFVKTDGRLEKILFADLLYIEALQNYVMIYTTTRKYIVHLTIKSLLEQLPADLFIQPHKSWLVAVDKIKSIEGNQLFIGTQAVPLSKYLKEAVLEKIVNNRLLKR